MKRLLAISALAFLAAACGPKESRVVILECSEDKKEDPPTVEQIQKATADDPDRIKKILLDENYKEDYGEKYPYYPFLWIIDKKLGIDYEYSAFEEALVPYKDKPAEQDGPYDQIYTTIKTRLSDDGKIFLSEWKQWKKNILLGEYGHETVIERINLETLKLEGKNYANKPLIQQCIEHEIPKSIKINFPKGN